MTQERLIRELLVLRDVSMFSVFLSLMAFFILIVQMKKLKIQKGSAKGLGIFVGLGGRSLLLLGGAWVKATLFIGMLVLSQYITAMHIVIIFYLAFLIALLKPSLGMMAIQLFSGSMLCAGIMVSNTLLSYLKQIRFEWGLQITYWLLVIFLVIVTLAVFVKEATIISSERKYFDATGETE